MKIKEVNLTKKQRVELEYVMHFDPRPFMQKRCLYVLKKSEGRSSQSIADELQTSVLTVNRWVNRYLASGMDGLRNKPGQGAKPIMDSTDTEKVIEAIQKDRLSVMKAKERWQSATGKEASRSTFRSFLSALAQDLDV